MAKDKEFTIIVNTREKTVTGKVLTYEEVVKLAYDEPQAGQNICYTVTYRKGHGNSPEGDLVEGAMSNSRKG